MKRTQVLTVNPHERKFSVTRRVPPLPGGPEWAVFEGGSGPGADVVAHLFSEADAQDYAQWRATQPSDRSYDDMRASMAAIHYHATRPTCPTTIAMDALLYTIRDECERCLPQLKRVRPNTERSHGAEKH